MGTSQHNHINNTSSAMCNTPKTTTSTKDSKAAPQRCTDKIVDFVNPKLKSFSRPLMLAIVIGALTLVLTLFLFQLMMQAGVTTGSGDTKKEDIDTFIEDVGPTCIVHPQSRLDIYYINDTPAIRYSNCYLPEEELAGVPTWCSAEEKAQRDEFIAKCKVDYADQADPDVCNCKSAAQARSSVVNIKYVVSPDAMTTLGAAFGYSGFIELLVTVIVIGVLSMCGCINKDNSYLKALIQQAKEEQDTATEIKDAGGIV